MFWNANMVLVYLDFKCFAADWRFWRCAISSEFTGNTRSLGFGILVFTADLNEGSNVCSAKEINK